MVSNVAVETGGAIAKLTHLVSFAGPYGIAAAAAATVLIALTQHPFGIGKSHLYANDMTGGPQLLFNQALAHVVEIQQYDKSTALAMLNDSWDSMQTAANEFGGQGSQQRQVAINCITSYTESRDVDFPSYWKNLDSVFRGITIAMPALGLFPSRTFTSGTETGGDTTGGKKQDVPLDVLGEAGIIAAIKKFLHSLFSKPPVDTSGSVNVGNVDIANWTWLIILLLIILALFLFTRD